MTVNHLKMEIEPIPETSCIPNTSQKMHGAQHNIGIKRHNFMRSVVFTAVRFKSTSFG